MSLAVTILAAGKGTRMKSSIPKVLHSIAGKPLLQWVLDAATEITDISNISIINGFKADMVETTLAKSEIHWFHQQQQLGTGHAVLQGQTHWQHYDQLLVLYGDTPFISPDTLAQIIKSTPTNAVGLLTANLDEPYGLGRIVRDTKGQVQQIVEQKDATSVQKQITEINTGILLLPTQPLQHWLANCSTNNTQSEYYLTDIIAMAVADGVAIHTSQLANISEAKGVNSRQQLVMLEKQHNLTVANQLLEQGVTIVDPARFDCRGKLECGQDVTIDINVIIKGHVTIADGVEVGANCILENVVIEKNTKILPNSILQESYVGAHCNIGPYARCRPGSQLANHVKIGNFVETKKAVVGSGSKIPHLSYIGDAEIGECSNLGAGVITANYDGVNKYKTTIGSHVFVGCDTQLIAPVTLEDNAFIGCGSTINKTAPAGKLTLGRAKQITLNHWAPPNKNQENS